MKNVLLVRMAIACRNTNKTLYINLTKCELNVFLSIRNIFPPYVYLQFQITVQTQYRLMPLGSIALFCSNKEVNTICTRTLLKIIYAHEEQSQATSISIIM